MMLLCALVKLDHGFLLFLSFDGAFSHFANLSDGVNAGNLLGLHQVTSQHGPSPAVTVHAVDRHALRRRKIHFHYSQVKSFIVMVSNFTPTFFVKG